MREQGQERGSAWGQAGRFGLERLRRGCRQRAARDTTVRAQEEVYRGQGKYMGVWEMLCSEGDQIGGRPEVFRWRGEEYRQPVYDAQGIATVRHAVTDEV